MSNKITGWQFQQVLTAIYKYLTDDAWAAATVADYLGFDDVWWVTEELAQFCMVLEDMGALGPLVCWVDEEPCERPNAHGCLGCPREPPADRGTPQSSKDVGNATHSTREPCKHDFGMDSRLPNCIWCNEPRRKRPCCHGYHLLKCPWCGDSTSRKKEEPVPGYPDEEDDDDPCLFAADCVGDSNTHPKDW